MDEKDFTPFKSSPVVPIFEKFSKARDVSLVYGDPIVMQGRAIVTVAKVKYSVGAGAGGGYASEGEDSTSPGAGGQGEGIGGTFRVKPVGIYDITAEKTIYRPIVPVELIILLPLMVTGIAMLMSSRQDKSGRVNHKKRGRMSTASRCESKLRGMKTKGMKHNS